MFNGVKAQQALPYATVAHAGQMRKFADAGESYIEHPKRVALHVQSLGGSDEQVAAGLLHDTLEDCKDLVSFDELNGIFGSEVAHLVYELTTPELKFSRAERAKHEAVRLARISPEAKLIKLCDIEDNLRSTVGAPALYAKIYISEKLLHLPSVRDGARTREQQRFFQHTLSLAYQRAAEFGLQVAR